MPGGILRLNVRRLQTSHRPMGFATNTTTKPAQSHLTDYQYSPHCTLRQAKQLGVKAVKGSSRAQTGIDTLHTLYLELTFL